MRAARAAIFIVLNPLLRLPHPHLRLGLQRGASREFACDDQTLNDSRVIHFMTLQSCQQLRILTILVLALSKRSFQSI